jgi:hypothetical protein
MVGERLIILEPNASRDHDRRGKIWYNRPLRATPTTERELSRSTVWQLQILFGAHRVSLCPFHAAATKWQHTNCQTKNRTAPPSSNRNRNSGGPLSGFKEPSRSWKNYSNGSVMRILLLPNKSMPHLSGNVQNR